MNYFRKSEDVHLSLARSYIKKSMSWLGIATNYAFQQDLDDMDVDIE